MKIVEQYRTKWLGMIHETVDTNDDGYPYWIYARDRFETREDAAWYIQRMKEDKVYRKLFYDPTDVDNHPWSIYSGLKNKVA